MEPLPYSQERGRESWAPVGKDEGRRSGQTHWPRGLLQKPWSISDGTCPGYLEESKRGKGKDVEETGEHTESGELPVDYTRYTVP